MSVAGRSKVNFYERPILCRFLDAGMTNLSTRYGGRRPKSAKARSRGRLGTGGGTGGLGVLWRGPGCWGEVLRRESGGGFVITRECNQWRVVSTDTLEGTN